MSLKNLIKQFIPQDLWVYIRKQLILREHKRVAKICDSIIESYNKRKSDVFPINPKKKFANERIIWQYWGQGFDKLPEIVRICLDTVERHKGDYQLVRLSDENIAEYIDFPEEIYRKRESFSRTSFSDLLRCALLVTYGGVWIDATIFLTGSLPEEYFKSGFFYVSA